jgi:hypothetical protein
MKKIYVAAIISVILIAVSSCSIGNYKKSEFKKDQLKNKTIVFYMNPVNDTVQVYKKGLFISIPFTKQEISNRDIFNKSITDLAEETKVNLKFSDTLRAGNDSIIYVNASLIKNTWNASFFHMTMLSDIDYKIEGNETYRKKGRYRNYFGGHGKNFLYKSYKNANFQIIQKITDSLMVN